MSDKINGIASDTVKKATGKGWSEWIEFLDKAGAQELTHKAIAQWLKGEKLIASSWWCQAVTVGYEKAKHRRVLGQTVDAGFQIGVQKTLPISASQLWKLLISPAGLEVWLGNVRDFELKVGQSYATTQGVSGEIRSFRQGERLRLTWQPVGKPVSILQISISPANTKSALHFHQEKLRNLSQRKTMKAHWQKVLTELEELVLKRTVG